MFVLVKLLDAAKMHPTSTTKSFIEGALAEFQGKLKEDVSEYYIAPFDELNDQHIRAQDVDIDDLEQVTVTVVEQIGDRWYAEPIKAYKWEKGLLVTTDDIFEEHFT